jgi:hypothetical protein
MARKPNNEYMPDYSNVKPLHKKETAALNPENASGSTPLLISSHVVDWTQKYAKFAGEAVDMSKYPGVIIDWQKEYESEDAFWVPENRWTHEVTNQPVQISDDTYAIHLDADAYIKKMFKEYLDPETGDTFVDAYIAFVTRTLYRYINELESAPLVKEPDLIPQQYEFVLRWLPKFPCRIHYWTDSELEEKTNIVVEPGYVDCVDDSVLNVSIPFKIKRSIKNSFAYIKHDSLVYYIRIEKA